MIFFLDYFEFISNIINISYLSFFFSHLPFLLMKINDI